MALCAICTCDLVSNQFAGFNLANAAKQTAKLFLGHVLGQVVDNQIGLAVIVCWAGLHGWRAAVVVGGWAVGRGASSAGAICHRSLHVTDDLVRRGMKDGMVKKRTIGEENSHKQKKAERKTELIGDSLFTIFNNLELWKQSVYCKKSTVWVKGFVQTLFLTGCCSVQVKALK